LSPAWAVRFFSLAPKVSPDCANDGIPRFFGLVFAADKLETASIQRITGLKGAMSEAEGVFKLVGQVKDGMFKL